MSLTLFAVGDIMLGESPLCCGFGVKSVIQKSRADYLFRNVKNLFSSGDIVFGNLEAPITHDTNQRGINSQLFRGDPDFISELSNSHYSVLSVSNNHIMEHGSVAFQSTIATIENAGITPVGIKNKPVILTVQDRRIAFLAYSSIEDFVSDPLYERISSPQKIFHDIAALRSDVDFIILSLHWGTEFVPFPSPDQVDLGRKLVDAGCDVILGGHPHVLQGYEIYKGKPIIYSLGNFIFDFSFLPDTRRSVIVKIEFNPDNSLRCSFIPVILNDDYSVTLAKNAERDSILSDMDTIARQLEYSSVDEYRMSISDYSHFEKLYKTKARKKMKNQFIKNLYRYPCSLSSSIIKKFLRKAKVLI